MSLQAASEHPAASALDVGVTDARRDNETIVPDLACAQDAAYLDNPAYAALTTVHSRFALRSGRALRYQPETVGFLAVPASTSDSDWRDAARLVEPGGVVGIIHTEQAPPENWKPARTFDVVQMIGEQANGADQHGLVTLGPADVEEMLELVGMTNPGPFAARTIELGVYVGVRHDGALVAMAGERLHFTGWTEISSVCTAPTYRGRGMASLLVSALVAGIRRRSEFPFLHVVASNTAAIQLYERLGFGIRRNLTIAVVSPT